MHLGDLAADLQLQTLQFCTSRDLSTLSRTHTSLRDAAEYMLYSDIDFPALSVGTRIEGIPRTCQSLMTLKTSLLHTLSTNARKAAMVKALFLELRATAVRDQVPSILIQLSEALQCLPNLVDLCIVYHWMKELPKGCLFKPNDQVRLCTPAIRTVVIRSPQRPVKS
jgi:hypothetical protein